MKFLSRLACLGLLSLSSLTRAEAQNSSDCGNLNQRACQHSDWARTNLVAGEDRACEVDLKESGGYCVNDRRNLQGVRRSQWAAWALENQLTGIGENAPLNFLSWPAAHQAYANPPQGFPAALASQSLSLTDQLNAGARLVVFDVRSYAAGANAEALRLCRTENGAACAHPEGRFRLLGYALQELANWLDANPGQVVLVRLNNDPPLGSRIAALSGEIQRMLGTRVFPAPTGTPSRWPTPSEMRAAGKTVLVAQFQGPATASSAWIWNATGLAQISDRVMDQNLEGCVANDGMDLAQRGSMRPLSWWDVAESSGGGMLDGTLVRKAVRCGVASVGLTQMSATDARLPAMVWSWAEGDWGRNGAAMLNHEGRWTSAPETQVLPVACASRRPLGHPLQDRTWRITSGAVAWNASVANDLCMKEFSADFAFSAPDNAYQNHALATVAAGRQVWLHYKVTESSSLSLSSRKMVFQMRPGGGVPATQTLLIGGTAGTPVGIKVMPGLPLTVSAMSATLPTGGFPLVVGFGSGLFGMPPGVHRGGVQLTTGGQSTQVEVELTVRAAPALSLGADPATAVVGAEVTLRLDLTGAYQPVGEYSIQRMTNGVMEPLAKGVMTSFFGSTAVAKVTLTNIPVGTHSLLAMALGDVRNLPASAKPVTVTIRPRLTATPAALELPMFQGAALPQRDVALAGLGGSPVAAVGCPWLKAEVLGSLMRVEGTEGVRQLALGAHRCDVTVTDTLTAQGLGRLVVPVTLLVQASLTAQTGGDVVLVGDGTATRLLTLATSAAAGVEISVSASVPWLQVTAGSSMRAPGVFQITATGGTLSYGRHHGEVIFRSAVTPELRVPVVFDRVRPTLIETHPAGMPFTVDGANYRGVGTFYWKIGSEHQLEMLPYLAGAERKTPEGWEVQNALRLGAKTTLQATAQGGFVTALFTSWYRVQLLPDSNGTIGVTASSAPDGEYYRHGTNVELRARPNIGFGDVTWNVDYVLGQVTSDQERILLTIFSPNVVRA